MKTDAAISLIVARGFTERQARFLVLVARHSGVCVMRQYAAFADVVFGHTTRRFFTKLERLGWVSTYDCARKRARLYHLRHREVYEALGDPESRLRRPPTVPRAIERVMLLDVIQQDAEVEWLVTPEEKRTRVEAHTGIKPEDLPRVNVSEGGALPPRYFPGHLPIGIYPDGRWVLLCPLVHDGRRELLTFLERHLPLLAGLRRWRVRVVIPAHMAAHGIRAVEEASKNLRLNLDGGGQLRDDIHWYFTMRRTGGNPDQIADDDDRAWRARLRNFSGLGYSAMYAWWLERGELVYATVSGPVARALCDKDGMIEPVILPHAYSHLAPLVGVA